MPLKKLIALLACLPALSIAQTRLLPGYIADERDSYPESHVFHIMFKTQKAAEEALGPLRPVPAARRFEAFKAAAVAKSIDPGSASSGGDLGLVAPGQMDRQFEAGVFATPAGQISDPVQSALGWHLVYIDKTKETPVARICAKGLSGDAKNLPPQVRKAVELSRNYRPALENPARVKDVIGADWGPPQQQADDLSFFKVAAIDSRRDVFEVQQHVEYLHAQLHGSMACMRSARTRWAVNCSKGTVNITGRDDFELRGAQGRVLNHLTWPDKADSVPPAGGFRQYIRDLACRAG